MSGGQVCSQPGCDGEHGPGPDEHRKFVETEIGLLDTAGYLEIATVLRAALAFHDKHEAMLAGNAAVVEVSAAEEALHVAIWNWIEGDAPVGRLP